MTNVRKTSFVSTLSVLFFSTLFYLPSSISPKNYRTIDNGGQRKIPPCYAAPLIPQKIMDYFPKAATAVSQLSGLVTDEEMIAMNFSIH